MRSRTVFGPSIDWSVSSAVLSTDGVAIVLGSPFTSRGSVLAARCASTATPASDSTRGWPTASTDGSDKHRLCTVDRRLAAQPEPASTRGARQFCALRSSWTRLLRVAACFCQAAFSFTSSQGRHRHRSVCAHSETVVAANKRICAALRREARITINTALTAASTTKR